MSGCFRLGIWTRRDPHVGDAKGRDMVLHLMLQVAGQAIGFGDGGFWCYLDGNIGVEAMTEPARLDVQYAQYPFDVPGRVADLVGDGRIDAVEHAHEQGPGGLPHDSEDRDRDQQTHNRVG